VLREALASSAELLAASDWDGTSTKQETGNRLSVLVRLDCDGEPTAPGRVPSFEIHFKG
jgi:hypothetical protein